MKALIPPPLVLLICGLSMFLIDRLAPSFDFELPYRIILFSVVLLTGLSVLAMGAANILKRKTTIHPDKKSLSHPSSLVSSGIFGYSRNPIYLGMSIMLVAWVLFLENWLTILGVIIFVAFITQYQIKPEEEALDRIFGEEYARYRKRVRRWI
jgi:protein-S-isoprenylcysteine O-methyltransferase Ste14